MCPKEFGKERDVELTAARSEHEALISKLMRRPGDSEGAMIRAESLFGLAYWSQWNLRHKRRATEKFMRRVRAAYLAVCEQSVRCDLERLKAEAAKGTDDADLKSLVAEAEALLARISEKVK